MKEHLYEILWQVETDSHSFLYREFKVFRSESEAKQYGERREVELNEQAPIEDRAQDGYYFRYYSTNVVSEIDDFIIKLALKSRVKHQRR